MNEQKLTDSDLLPKVCREKARQRLDQLLNKGLGQARNDARKALMRLVRVYRCNVLVLLIISNTDLWHITQCAVLHVYL